MTRASIPEAEAAWRAYKKKHPSCVAKEVFLDAYALGMEKVRQYVQADLRKGRL